MPKRKRPLPALPAALLGLFLLCGGQGCNLIDTSARPGGSGDSTESIPRFSDVTVHDPSVFPAGGGEFRVIGSFLATAKTSNFMQWTQEKNDFSTATYSQSKYYPTGGVSTTPDTANQTIQQQINDVLRGQVDSLNFYASDIHQMPNGKYYHYYSLTCSAWCSAIGVAIADNVDGPYETQGLIVRSKEAGNNKAPDGTTAWSASRHPNCIDPQAFFDHQNNFWLVYGSWRGGIYLLQLDPATGLPNNAAINSESDGYGRRILKNINDRGIEAPYIIYSPEAQRYFLFVSYDGLTATGGYHIRMFRSQSNDASGPYLDRGGHDVTTTGLGSGDYESHGVKVLGGYQFAHLSEEKGTATTGYLSPGHNSAYYDSASGKYFLIHHTRFVGRGEGHQVRVREMFLNEDDWLVAAPFRYDAGTVRAFTEEALAGTWKLINHGKDRNTTAHTSETYQFESDGSVVPAGGGAVVGGAGTSAWSLEADSRTAHITIDGVRYKGVFLRQWDDDNKVWVYAFTALSDDGTALWGAQPGVRQ
ncbi:MAG: glycoside hydrolase family 43 protein [Treponema sp.]|jgi:arabinan endo-1,5-alpha-L-arabinosidase|nr:glycoside hydrolase family 43 protein [Treponema sp.]